MRRRWRYRLLVLDFDGTLADTLPDISHCLTEAFLHHGVVSPSAEAIRATVGAPLEHGIQHLLGEDEETDRVREVARTYRDVYQRERGRRTRVVAGAAEALRELGEHGIRTVVTSNKSSGALVAALASTGLAPFVQDVLGADDVRYRKPDPRLYHLEIRPRYPGVPPADTLVVGDTLTDLAFARGAGLAACWASYGYGDPDACRLIAPEFTISCFGELRAVLAGGA